MCLSSSWNTLCPDIHMAFFLTSFKFHLNVTYSDPFLDNPNNKILSHSPIAPFAIWQNVILIVFLYLEVNLMQVGILLATIFPVPKQCLAHSRDSINKHVNAFFPFHKERVRDRRLKRYDQHRTSKKWQSSFWLTGVNSKSHRIFRTITETLL